MTLTTDELTKLLYIRPDQFTIKAVKAAGVDSYKVVEAALLGELPEDLIEIVLGGLYWGTEHVRTAQERLTLREALRHHQAVETILGQILSALQSSQAKSAKRS